MMGKQSFILELFLEVKSITPGKYVTSFFYKKFSGVGWFAQM